MIIVAIPGTTRVLLIEAFEWSAGTGRNVGSILIGINIATQLPSMIRFDGIRREVQCGFDHIITFDPALVINCPTS